MLLTYDQSIRSRVATEDLTHTHLLRQLAADVSHTHILDQLAAEIDAIIERCWRWQLVLYLFQFLIALDVQRDRSEEATEDLMTSFYCENIS